MAPDVPYLPAKTLECDAEKDSEGLCGLTRMVVMIWQHPSMMDSGGTGAMHSRATELHPCL